MDIILTTLNAKYPHCAFGLRYLMANLAEDQARAKILEFDINQRVVDITETILAHHPKIVGLGVYIWNAPQSAQLVANLKQLRPDLIIIIGGPEVSYEIDQQQICRDADYVITGEADLAFAQLCRRILSGREGAAPVEPVVVERASRPLDVIGRTGGTPVPLPGTAARREPRPPKIIAASPPTFDKLILPYDFYDERDVAHRVIYVEASRGCPFECEFCLSSLDVPVRNAAIEPFLTAMQSLLDRGVNQFKFVDRTFNLNIKISEAILLFFLERQRPGLFVHFEMIPDRLPDPLRAIIKQFPPGALQFEVGIQTFNEQVAHLISRRQDNTKAEENLRWLRTETGVHIHTDLIVGLPGEDAASFGNGFDRLMALHPQEIQVGLLKRLRGTPIIRHDQTWEMVYSQHPPYEILQTKLIDFFTMQRLRRFARYWDLVANSGNFIAAVPLLLGNCWASAPLATKPNQRLAGGAPARQSGSSFQAFLRFSDWLYQQTHQTHAIARSRLAELIDQFLSEELNMPIERRPSRLPTRSTPHLAPLRQLKHLT